MPEEVSQQSTATESPQSLVSNPDDITPQPEVSVVQRTGPVSKISVSDSLDDKLELGDMVEWQWREGLSGEGDKPEGLDTEKYENVEHQLKCQDKSIKDMRKKLGEFHGAPEEDYEFTLDDSLNGKISLDKNDPLLNQFAEYAKSINMSTEGYNNLVNMFLGNQLQSGIDKGSVPQTDEERQDYVKDQMTQLGEGAEEQLNTLVNWGKNNMTENEFTLFTQMLNTADNVKLFQRIKSFKGYQNPPDEHDGIKNKAIKREDLDRMMDDPRYRTKKSFQKMVDDGYKSLYGQ